MWIGGTIYNSDKDGKFNLTHTTPPAVTASQVTRNRDWDIRWPSSDNLSRIVYERDGELEIFDVNSKKATHLSISVPDDGVNRRKRVVNAASNISSYSLSPKGERALFSARGDIFFQLSNQGRRSKSDEFVRR